MKRCNICLLVLCLSLWVGFAIAQGPEKQKAAVAAAEEWLSLVDSENYGQSWKEAAGLLTQALEDGHIEVQLQGWAEYLIQKISCLEKRLRL